METKKICWVEDTVESFIWHGKQKEVTNDISLCPHGKSCIVDLFSFFFFGHTMAHGCSQARDPIQAAAATYATAEAMPDP